MRLNPDRQIGDDLGHFVRYGLAEDEVVATLRHRDGEADRRLAVETEHRLRRIGIAFLDRCHIGEPKKLAVGKEIDALQVFDRVERAGNPDSEFLLTGLDDAGRCHSVLLAQGLDDLVVGYAKPGELTVVEFEVEFLVLSAEQLYFGRILYGEDLGADFFDIVAQLAVSKTIGSESINDAEDVAELVIVIGSNHTLRQRALDVGNLLANLIPDFRYLFLWRVVQHVYINGRGTGLGITLEIVEPRRLLQFLFNPVGHLQHRVVDRGTRPLRLHEHRLDRKARVFLASELDIGEDAGDDEQQHQVPDEGAMVDRPFGEVEARHHPALACIRRTFWPGRSFCTPPVTTTSPCASPSPTTTKSPW